MNDPIGVPGGDAAGDEPLEITAFYPPPLPGVDPRPPRMIASYPARRPFRTNRPLTVALFLATCVSVFLAGMAPGGGVPLAYELLYRAWLRGNFAPVWTSMAWNGLIFFGALMTTLMAHEMGHFLQAKRYGVPANGPYFIPFPLTPFGTMGAVIIQGAGVADRKSMFDIAISGPLAGLVFALPITAIGIMKADIIATAPGGFVFNDPLILKAMTQLIHGPLPENYELRLNAWLFAGWVGIFITALNLVPIGQLDGGHILYTLIGRGAHRVAMTLLFGAVAYMIMSRQPAYALIVVLLFVSGPRHPPTADDSVPLGFGRVALGWVTLAFLLVGFTPKPFEVIPDQPRQPAPQQLHEREGSSELIEVRATPRSNPARSSQLVGTAAVARTWSRGDRVPSNLVTAEPRNRELGVVLAKFHRTWRGPIDRTSPQGCAGIRFGTNSTLEQIANQPSRVPFFLHFSGADFRSGLTTPSGSS
jgi:Zn-dependent protease